MSKVRWLEAHWPCGIRAISEALKKNAFDDESDDGFLITRIRNNRLEGCHIEKISTQETILNPFGMEISQSRLVYKKIEFVLQDTFPQIEIHNHQRGLNLFLERMLESLDFDLVIKPIEVDPIQWITALSSIFDGIVEIRAIQASGIDLLPGITGELVAKSESDITPHLEKLTNPKWTLVKKVNAVLHSSPSITSAVFSRNSTINFKELLESELIPCARKALAIIHPPTMA